ncbi:MAG: hypothetical protein IPI79_10540 [Moraxellaceae bacterium]|nr:hypothetical protein [Moraxellaceae bacterium]
MYIILYILFAEISQDGRPLLMTTARQNLAQTMIVAYVLTMTPLLSRAIISNLW